MFPLYSFIISSILSFFCVGLILPQLKQNILDTPNERSSHIQPTPRGGGITFVIIGSLFSVFFSSGVWRWIPVMCVPLALLGLLDDRKDVPASWRYSVQFLTGISLVLITRPGVSVFTLFFLAFFITGIINFMNFMDGLDGLLAGCSVFLMAAASAWSTAGGIFGFLIWNWSPAKVFMGDVGSTFIGAVFAGLILNQSTGGQSLMTLLLAFPLLWDATLCIIRRFLHKKNIFTPHRQHLYQRLNQAGWNHSKVATLYIAAVAWLVIAKSFNNWIIFSLVIISEAFVAVVLDLRVAVKFEES